MRPLSHRKIFIFALNAQWIQIFYVEQTMLNEFNKWWSLAFYCGQLKWEEQKSRKRPLKVQRTSNRDMNVKRQTWKKAELVPMEPHWRIADRGEIRSSYEGGQEHPHHAHFKHVVTKTFKVLFHVFNYRDKWERIFYSCSKNWKILNREPAVAQGIEIWK